jgi:hypothetical protein
VTATFRGAQGLDKMLMLLKNSVAITSGNNLPKDRILDLDIYG